LRFLYLNQLTGSPFFNFPIVDEFEYDKWAREILSGRLLWDSVPHHGPVYPYLLTGLFKIFGHSLYIARLFGIIISSLTAVLLGHICWESINKRTGVIAGILAAVYWPFIYWSGELVVETLVVFLNLIVFLLLWKSKDTRRPGLFFLSGLITGLSAITRPNILFLVPLFLIWIFMISPRKTFMKNALLLMLGMAIVITPITLRNYFVSGEFIIIQANSGLNLYLGLNPHLASMYDIRAGIVWDKWMLEPIRLNILSPGAQNRFWIDKAVALISIEPFLFLKHIFQNIMLNLSGFEIYADKSILYNRIFSPFIFSLPGFWLIGPLGICGAIMSIDNWRRLSLHYLFLIGIFLSSIPFQTSSRLRLPFVVFILIFAAFAVSEFIKITVQKDRRGISYFFVTLFLGIGIVIFDIPDVKSKAFSATHLNLAGIYLKKCDLSRALDENRQFLYSHPKDPDGYKMLGDIYLAMKDLSRAEGAYQRALKLEPEYFRAANNIGTIKAMGGDLEGARHYFERATAIYPYYDEALRNLKRCSEAPPLEIKK